MPKARQLHPNMLAVRSFKIQPLIWPIVVELWMSFVGTRIEVQDFRGQNGNQWVLTTIPTLPSARRFVLRASHTNPARVGGGNRRSDAELVQRQIHDVDDGKVLMARIRRRRTGRSPDDARLPAHAEDRRKIEATGTEDLLAQLDDDGLTTARDGAVLLPWENVFQLLSGPDHQDCRTC